MPSASHARRHAPALAMGCSVTAALLAACAAPPVESTLPAYAAPAADAPSARLLLRGAVGPTDRYLAVALADNAQCSQPSLVARGDAQQPPVPARLHAGQLTTLNFVVLRPGATVCDLRFSFTPLAGKSYLLQGMLLGNGCTAGLADISVPDRPRPVPDLMPRTGPGMACVPMAQAQAQRRGADALIQGGQQGGEAVLNPRATAKDLEGLIKR